MAIGDPQKVINPGGHSYGGKETKVAKARVKAEAGMQKLGKQRLPRRDRSGEVIMDPRDKRGPKSQPSTFTARNRGGYDPAKGTTKDVSPKDTAKKKPKKTSGVIKGKTRR